MAASWLLDTTPLVRSIGELFFWLALFALVAAPGIWWIAKIRARAAQQEPGAGEMLAKFREWHSQGGLSDAEFRTIRTTLAPEVQEQLPSQAGPSPNEAPRAGVQDGQHED
jgi:hypothetical protein